MAKLPMMDDSALATAGENYDLPPGTDLERLKSIIRARLNQGGAAQ